MLKIVFSPTCGSKVSYFQGFDPENETWVVSDLRSKFDLQDRVLEKQGYFEDHSVLRASELWRELLKRAQPEYRIVSKDFALLFIKSELKKKQLKVNESAVDTVFAYLDQLAPILSTPGSEDAILGWFEENPEAAGRWGQWYELCFSLWQSFKREKILVSPWIGGALLSVVDLKPVWNRPLIFDLGTEILRVEADLIKHLSRYCDVRVLNPNFQSEDEFKWKEGFKFLLRPYEFLVSQSNSKETLHFSFPQENALKFFRFSSHLAEVKFAVSRIRQWLEKGVKPTQIAVLAPNIEIYWPVLAQYLKQEGVPSGKNEASRMHSHLLVAKWIAKLQIECGIMSAEDLETSLYSDSVDSPMRFERFQSLYSLIFGSEDLARESKIESYFERKYESDEELTRDELVVWLVQHWPLNADSEIVKKIVDHLYLDTSGKTVLSVQDWIALVKAVIYRIETVEIEADAKGIQVANLMSAQYLPVTHRLFLGLSEEELRRPTVKTQIVSDDIVSLSRNLDFHLYHPDHSSQEFELHWLAQTGGVEDCFCFGWSDFSGQILSPAQFWIEGRIAQEGKLSAEFDSVEKTRWDLIQNADFYEFVEKERKRSKAEVENLKNSFANDWGHAPIPAFAPSEAWRLSASSLETYLDCPFKFAAGKVFGLLDEPTLDLDLDKRTKGQIGHLLFERILSGEDLSSWNAEKIAAILEMEFQEKRILLSDSRLWQKIKNRHVILGLRFVEFEKEWRKRFPQTKTVGREVSFRGFLDPDGNWHVEPGPGTTEFTGKIDRIDEDGNKRKAVIDYKSSQFGITPFQNWFKDRALQLALYTMIVETGLAEGLERSQVIAALYFNFRNFDRDLGFKIVDAVGSLYDLEGKRKRAHHISEAERESEFAKLKTLIVEAVQNIKKGQFQPVPLDEKQCEYCNWSGLCRSPHLNS